MLKEGMGWQFAGDVAREVLQDGVRARRKERTAGDETGAKAGAREAGAGEAGAGDRRFGAAEAEMRAALMLRSSRRGSRAL